ncbi:MAG: phosphopyruvate hydratase [Halobacteriales archaeon]
MSRIADVRLRRVLDSRGEATVEADVATESGGFGRAIAPSGASTGAHEAVERPPDEAIAAAREHAVPRLEGECFAGDQREVDAALHAADGTDDFSTIGANSAVAISMAAAWAAADLLRVPLFQHLGGAFRGDDFPVPLGNVVGGGAHAADATAIQEFHAVPVGAPSAVDAVFANAAVHRAVGEAFRERGVPANKGDEGAWAPQGVDDAAALEVLAAAADAVADEFGFAIELGLDVAASELYDAEAGVYRYADAERTPDEQVDYMADLVDEHDLAYLEDPLDEDDFEGYATLTDRVGDRTVVCGDDLFVTDVERLERGIEAGAANAVLVKPNQIGTLSDAVDAIEAATRAGYTPVVSHRSGETEDTTIAHLAVATGAPFVKTGAVGGERTAKLNELIRIEHEAL